jgi:integrase
MELFSPPWPEVDLEAGTVRSISTKNGKGRTVILNSLALELIKKLKSEAAPNCPWVFPARTGHHTKDARKAIWKAMKEADLRISALGRICHQSPCILSVYGLYLLMRTVLYALR